MTKPRLQLESVTLIHNPYLAEGEIVEVHNVTLKEAIELVRSLAIASPRSPQSESDHSK
jgi:hypothetical protein